MEVFMKGIFNKMLVAALLVSVVPGMYAMNEAQSSQSGSVKNFFTAMGSNVAELYKKSDIGSKALDAAYKVGSLAKDHTYVTGYLAADTLWRGKKSFVGSFAGSLFNVRGVVGLAAAYGVYKAVPVASDYYSTTIAPTVTKYGTNVSDYFSRISNAAVKAYEGFRKPAVVNVDENENGIELNSVQEEAPVVKKVERGGSAKATTMPLPVMPTRTSSTPPARPAPTRKARTNSLPGEQRVTNTVTVEAVDEEVVQQNKSVVAQMKARFEKK